MQLVEKDKKTRTAIVCPIVRTSNQVNSLEDIKNREDEASGLVVAMGQEAVLCCSVKVQKIIPGSFFGKGVS